MSGFIMGEDLQQEWLLPQSVEEYVSEDNPVRFIDAFVDGVDFATAGIVTQPAVTGRPGYAPEDLLKLYVYGYLNRVRSSRELERLTHRNLEVMWLLKCLRPDHKTISEFRRKHRNVFKQVFRQFNLLCRELKLFGAELVAIDGSIFKAVNSKARNYTQAKLKGLLKAVDKGVGNYLKDLERNDASEAAARGPQTTGARNLGEKIEALQAAKERYEHMLAQIEASPGSQISLTDPDARLMTKSTSKDCIVGYNVQSAVDAAHHLIVEIEATTQPTDHGQLNRIAQRAKETLGTPKLSVTADGGYYAASDLKAAEAQGIQAHVPAPADKMDNAGLYGREQFRYHRARDEYECPGAERLTRHSDNQEHGRVYEVYYNSSACARCALRPKCTTGKYRKLKHVAEHELLERIKARMKRAPEVYAQRKALVEHPFGTWKFWWGQGAFLTRGQAAVNVEITLSALAYNLKRAIHVLGVPALLMHLCVSKARAAS